MPVRDVLCKSHASTDPAPSATVVMGGSAIGTIFVFFVSPLIISSNFGTFLCPFNHSHIRISRTHRSVVARFCTHRSSIRLARCVLPARHHRHHLGAVLAFPRQPLCWYASCSGTKRRNMSAGEGGTHANRDIAEHSMGNRLKAVRIHDSELTYIRVRIRI